MLDHGGNFTIKAGPQKPSQKATTPESSSSVDSPAGQVSQPNSNTRVSSPDTISSSSNVNFALKKAVGTWLAWQCGMIAGVIRGSVYLPSDGILPSPIASWPEVSEGSVELVNVSLKSYHEKTAVTFQKQRYGAENQRLCDLLSCPLMVEGQVIAIFSCGVSARSEPQRNAILQLMQWGSLWLTQLIQQHTGKEKRENIVVPRLVEYIFDQQSCHEASIEAVNRLADQLHCERVSLGLNLGPRVILRAFSHVTDFDPRSELIRQIEAAMEEAIDQQMMICSHYAKGEKHTNVTVANRKLASRNDNVCVYSIPLPSALAKSSHHIGAITLERKSGQPLDEEEIAICREFAKLLGPLLELKQQNERPIKEKLFESLRSGVSFNYHESSLKFKIHAAVAATLVLLLCFVDGDYRITAPANIEASSRQLLVAPQDGFVKQSHYRAGDIVKQGELIASLEERGLVLEQQKWQSEFNKVEREYQQALANHDRTQVSILQARRKQLNAEIKLVDERMSRTRLSAPFDGVIVSGDLSQSLGAPISMGDVLFEIAPVGSYKVNLEVDEFDIRDVDTNKNGKLILSSFPQQAFTIHLDRVIPIAFSADGRNFFRIEATIAGNPEVLRPGMQGVAKIDMGQRKLIWIWTHAVIDRLFVWAWSFGL